MTLTLTMKTFPRFCMTQVAYACALATLSASGEYWSIMDIQTISEPNPNSLNVQRRK